MERVSDCKCYNIKLNALLYFINVKTFDINKQNFQFFHLSELVRFYFDPIFKVIVSETL